MSNTYKSWIIDTEANYIAYSEGIYYKQNNAIIYRLNKKELVLRNTWTGEERVLNKGINKTEALKQIKIFIKSNTLRLKNKMVIK